MNNILRSPYDRPETPQLIWAQLDTAFRSLTLTKPAERRGKPVYRDRQSSAENAAHGIDRRNWNAYTARQLTVAAAGRLSLVRWMPYTHQSPYDCFAATTDESCLAPPFELHDTDDSDNGRASDLLWAGGTLHGNAILLNGERVDFGNDIPDRNVEPVVSLAANIALAALSEFKPA